MPFSAQYWIDQTGNPDQVLLDQAEIEAFNHRLYTTNHHMVDLALFPDSLSAREVRETIQGMSKPFEYDLYNEIGDRLDPKGYSNFTANLGLDRISRRVRVQFALVVNRTDMRTYPTIERFFKSPEKNDLDRFQENGLFPGDAVAVLHVSADNKWCFVQSYNYAAWVRKEHIAIGDRKTIQNYKDADNFLVITGAMESTSHNPGVPALSELQLDMGVCIPRADGDTEKGGPDYTVLLPVRDAEGGLAVRQAYIDKNKDVSEAFIPFTRENIIRQAFKFLGEHYGWGHSNNARDCTGFVMEIYKTFGIHMPRNSYQQGSGEFGENIRFDTDSKLEEKLRAVGQLDVGDLIYVQGHVLMHIGNAKGQPHIIHDVSTFRTVDEIGEYQEKALNGVMVAPLNGLRESRDATYIDKIYNLKRIR